MTKNGPLQLSLKAFQSPSVHSIATSHLPLYNACVLEVIVSLM